MIHEESINSIENRCNQIYCKCETEKQRIRITRMRRVFITAIAYEFYGLGFIDSPFLMYINSKNRFIRKEKCTLSREEIVENNKKYEEWFKKEYCS